MSIFTYLSGTAKKWFPSTWGGSGNGVLDALEAGRDGDLYTSMSQNAAMKLSAVNACVTTRSEAVSALPLVLLDEKQNNVEEHDVFGLLNALPNSYMTKPDFESMSVALVDLEGNQLSLIERNSRTGAVRAINPIPGEMGFDFRPSPATGRPEYVINGMTYKPEDVLHMRGFGLDGIRGLSRLQAGRNILSAQYEADLSTMRAFKQGLKVGGFFETPTTSQDMTDDQFTKFMTRMQRFSSSENQSKWMPLPPGMKPVTTGNFKISPVDVELLNSRYFGIEEICRLFQTPPPIIGHTNKSSSWASSTEQLNLHFLTYSIMPTLVRRERTYWHKLLTPVERAKLRPMYQVNDLSRVDLKTRQAFWASGLQNGYLSQNEVREMMQRPGIGPDGDEYRVQLNMANAESDKPVADFDKEK